jgi:hypothetical protein
MTKTLNQIIFVFLHQNQNIFFSNIGNQNIFLDTRISDLSRIWLSCLCPLVLLPPNTFNFILYLFYEDYIYPVAPPEVKWSVPKTGIQAENV